jgi:hypothetical protein
MTAHEVEGHLQDGLGQHHDGGRAPIGVTEVIILRRI